MSVLPPEPWPGTPGGAWSPDWGPYIRVYVWAAIAGGTTLKWGPDPADRLSAGNLYGGTSPSPPGGAGGRLWYDLTCDVLSVDTSLGADQADGPITKPQAGTATIVLRDPSRKYDPLNPSSPFQVAGETRLGPGTAIKVWAEVVSPNGATDLATEALDQLVTEAGDQLVTEAPLPSVVIGVYPLHTGTVDTWSEEWEANPIKRRAQVVSSDAVKELVALDRGEQPPAGAGDTTDQRVQRILTYYGWTGTRVLNSSAVTLQATTMAQSAWELLGRTADDEIGLVYIDPGGVLRFYTRDVWSTMAGPAIAIGCSPSAPSAWDIALDAVVQSAGFYFANAIYATRTGGTQQTATSAESILRYTERGLKRTDLGLASDPQAATWASFLLGIIAWPRARIQSVTVRPGIDYASWSDVLNLDIMADRIAVFWQPPDATETVDATGRLIGVQHRISRHTWDVDLHMALADSLGRTLHWGPHPWDRLSSSYSYA